MMMRGWEEILALLIVAGLVWWFGTRIVERLDILIRQQGGEPPK
jgi:hypothetical protein